jgi:Calcineurin-like phosphoesterase/Purple acid Phosphatase, N-terminal domain
MRFRTKVMLLAVGFLLAFSITAFSLSVEKGPYLIFPGDNAQMTVLWQLDATSNCSLEWGTDTTYALGSVQTSEYGSDHQHKYTITGLAPGAKYFYRVNVGGSYHTGSFRSAPDASATNVKLLAYGDTRSYPADHDAVNAQMATTFTNDPLYQTLSFHVGDWVNDGDTESGWTNEFFGRSRSNTLFMQANLPIQGCMGNHEYSGVLYEKYWPYPFEPGGRYFSFDYGPAHIAVIDQYTDYSPGSTQYNWLQNDLTNSTKEWKFIVLHEPGWSAGGHSNDSNVQDWIQPLCLTHRVDIVFCGHNHYYAHCEVQGVHHVTTGGGGAPLYSPSSNADYLVYAEAVYQFCEIDIQGDQLYFTARDVNGSVVENFTVSHILVPQLPWSDGFESGEFTTGGWVTSGQVKISSDSYGGNYSAYTNRGASFEKSVSTEGLSNIHVKYARKTSSLESDEWLVVEWFDGSNWHELERTHDTAWGYVEMVCDAGADNNRAFKIRFNAAGTDSKEYCYVDAVEVFEGTSGPDTTPPNPDPMTWQTVPYATGTSSIAMVATTASDTSGVEYYFECVSGGGNHSGWQDSSSYEDTGLQPDTTYTYRVKARDKSTNLNETVFSNNAVATTQASGSAEIYVNDITMSFASKGPNYNGIAVVWIKDNSGNNIEGATVYGTWSGAVSSSAQGVTGADGKITFNSAKKKNGGTFTFTVTDVVKSGFTYNPTLNVETSDSVTTQ